MIWKFIRLKFNERLWELDKIYVGIVWDGWLDKNESEIGTDNIPDPRTRYEDIHIRRAAKLVTIEAIKNGERGRRESGE